jgi:dihydrodipicolinate synthase/N-acetylneuraminate lyase
MVRLKRCGKPVCFLVLAEPFELLANFSKQFLLGDDERELLTRMVLEHVAGRVPVIVTTTHFSTRICAARSRRAQAMGAAMVMVMPALPRRPGREETDSGQSMMGVG